MALTITKQTNGYFFFEPTSGEPRGDGRPKAKQLGDYIIFKDSDSELIEKVHYSDLTINDGSDHTFVSAKAAMDKLYELNFFFSVSGGSDPGYKVYRAIMTQVSTENPTVNVLENTFDVETVSVTRNDVGIYILNTSSDYFTQANTAIITSFNGLATGTNRLAAQVSGNDAIAITTSVAGSLADGVMTMPCYIEIQVYP